MAQARVGNGSSESSLARFGLGLANWSERWFPDPLVFALLGIVFVFLAGLCLHQSASQLAVQGVKNFWTLVPFTMQMVMIIIGGYVVATTPVVNRLIVALARVPKTGRGAIALIALFSMLTSLISWGLSLIFSGLLDREMARRVKGMDYRAAGAASYLGLGATWALGLSSSAAMLMATRSSHSTGAIRCFGRNPTASDIVSVAKHDHGSSSGRGLGGNRVPLGAVSGERTHRGRLRHHRRRKAAKLPSREASRASGWNIVRC